MIVMTQQGRPPSASRSSGEQQRHPSTNEEIRQLLHSWLEGNIEEQHETWELLKQALDEDRSSVRKLFP
jgi:hypothetical protein